MQRTIYMDWNATAPVRPEAARAVMRALESSTAGEVEHGYSAAESAAEVTALVPLAELVHLEAGLRQQTAGAVVPELLESGLVLYRAGPPRPSASA